jgi:mono/diheme cytochrome c family protein
MRFAALVIVLFALLTPAPAGAQTAAVERGAKLFAESKCSMCHAVAGKGNAKGALDDVGAKLSADEIREWLVDPAAMTAKAHAERKPPMKSYASLPKADLDGLVAYMQTLKAKK